MKTILEKLSSVCKLIFGYGIMLTLFVGGFTFFGYLIALLVGGDMAITICSFIYETIVPIMIYVTTLLILLGLLSMYLAGEKALTSTSAKKKKSK